MVMKFQVPERVGNFATSRESYLSKKDSPSEVVSIFLMMVLNKIVFYILNFYNFSLAMNSW